MNDKCTKRDILSAAGLFVIIAVLIVTMCVVGKMLGIEEFVRWF